MEALCREATISASKRSSDSLILTLQDFKIAKSVVGPSITRGITVEIPKVTWDDVGGLKDLKVNTLKRVIALTLLASSFMATNVLSISMRTEKAPASC